MLKPAQSLFLLRHAKAEPWSSTGNDFERHLSSRGLEQCQQAGLWLQGKLPAGFLALCSSAVRTRETLEQVTEYLPGHHAQMEPAIYEATPGDLLEIIGRGFKDHRNLLLIGHNPGLSLLARGLTVDGRHIELKTGGIAALRWQNMPESGLDLADSWEAFSPTKQTS